MTYAIENLTARLRAFGRRLSSVSPFAKLRRYKKTILQLREQLEYERASNQALGSLFLASPATASSARSFIAAPIKSVAVDELCLFVTHASAPDLKNHVVDHVHVLIDAGIQVLLVINADVDAGTVQIPLDLSARLYGCIVRQNLGFDFAAWAHGYCLVQPGLIRRRLFLINDSIIGPIDRAAYQELLEKIRASTADLIGLTLNSAPHPHLQSYYLAFNERLLHSDAFHSFMHGVVIMPMKQNVIDSYEIHLTRFFEQRGFQTAAMFPTLSHSGSSRRNDTLIRWKKLMEMGFPFVKSALLKDPAAKGDVRRILPIRYR